MSHSRRRTPIISNAVARSEKTDKLSAHRRERHRVRQTLDGDPLADLLPHTREVSDVWVFAKDGKTYVRDGLSPKDMRK